MKGALFLVLGLVCAQGFYAKGPVTEIVGDKAWKKEVLGSNHSSLVEFYAPWCGHCKNLKPEYISAAKKTKGIVPFFAVNCDDTQNTALCQAQGVQGYPTIKAFRPLLQGKTAKTKKNGKQSKTKLKPEIEDYRGERTAPALVEFAMSRVRNHVTVVKADTLEEFVSRPAAVVLVSGSDKKAAVPALLKVLAIDHFGQADFGYVSPRDGATRAQLGLDGQQSVLLVYVNGEQRRFEGLLKREAISEFIQEVLEGQTGEESGEIEESEKAGKVAANSAKSVKSAAKVKKTEKPGTNDEKDDKTEKTGKSAAKVKKTEKPGTNDEKDDKTEKTGKKAGTKAKKVEKVEEVENEKTETEKTGKKAGTKVKKVEKVEEVENEKTETETESNTHNEKRTKETEPPEKNKEKAKEVIEDKKPEAVQDIAEKAKAKPKGPTTPAPDSTHSKLPWKRALSFDEFKKECLATGHDYCLVLGTSATGQLGDFRSINSARVAVPHHVATKFKFVYLIDVDDEIKHMSNELKLSPYPPVAIPDNAVGPLDWYHGGSVAVVDVKLKTIVNLQGEVSVDSVTRLLERTADGKNKASFRPLPRRYGYVREAKDEL